MRIKTLSIIVFLMLVFVTIDVANAQTILYSDSWGLHKYYAIQDPVPWPNATDRIHSLLGPNYYLATITSQEEQDFIADFINVPSPVDYYFLGGYQDPTGLQPPLQQPWEDWNWVTGEKWDYTNWNTGEPNDAGPESYLMIYSHVLNQKWNDSNEFHGQGYIAETVIPEPGTILLLGSGFLGLGILGWFRKRKA